MEKKRVLESGRVLIRQTVWGLLVANVSLVIFVIIALVLSLFISNQVTLYVISFLLVTPFIINAYAKLFFYKNKGIDVAEASKNAKEKKIFALSGQKIKSLVYDFNLIGPWIAYVLFDALLLVILGYMQIMIHKLITNSQSHELDYWLLVGIWLLFATATFLPILTHMALTTIRGLVDGWIAIKIELTRLDENYLKKSTQNVQ